MTPPMTQTSSEEIHGYCTPLLPRQGMRHPGDFPKGNDTCVISMLQPIHQASVVEERQDVFSRILTKLHSLWVTSTYPFAGKGRKISLHYASEISRTFAPLIRLGNRVEVGKHTWFHTWYTPGLSGIQDVKITIEDDCLIAPRCTITAKNSIHFEHGVILGSDALIMDHNHAYENVGLPIKDQGCTLGGRIRIQEGCRIGNGVVILCDKGELVLGRNCVVTPGAVIYRSFPPDSVVSGNPARAMQKSDAKQTRGEHDSFQARMERGEAR
jgi:acetyltransferase-like isoleucine patch superfamily enzyme